MRKLAQRSADAAKEIKALINDSVEKVTDGTRLVDETGKTLGEIVNAVKKVNDIIVEIAAARIPEAADLMFEAGESAAPAEDDDTITISKDLLRALVTDLKALRALIDRM